MMGPALNQLLSEMGIAGYTASEIVERLLVAVLADMTGMVMTSYAENHDGFLRLENQWVLKSEYPRLYARIGGGYGETLTEFRLPPAEGLVVMGSSSEYPVGTIGGCEYIKMQNLPSIEDNGDVEFVHNANSFASNGVTTSLYSTVSDSRVQQSGYLPRNLRLNYFIKC
jgi:hypothetical protein